MKAKEFIPASKPRNFVAKNQKTAGAGAHRDKKKEQKQGYEKHKSKDVDEGQKDYNLDDVQDIMANLEKEFTRSQTFYYIVDINTGKKLRMFDAFDTLDNAKEIQNEYGLTQKTKIVKRVYKNRSQYNSNDVDEGLKSKIAGAALAAANLLGSPAQAAEEPVKPITIAYVMIDGEVRKYNLGDRFENAKEAEKFISGVLDKQGVSCYTLDIQHGYPKKQDSSSK